MDQPTDEMLPEEQQEQVRLQEEEKIQRLEAFGLTLSKRRDDAVSGRSSSGIEQEWLDSEEQYQGIDDANRGESSGAMKPATVGGSFIGKGKQVDTRSTVFMNITRPYVDAASAKVADMLLPTDDRNWGIKPTPIPELTQALQDETPVQQPMMPPQAGGQMPQPPVKVKDLAQQALKQATDAAEKAEKRIEDWLVECQYHAEVRKVIEDCAKLGTGILKGPFPDKKKRGKQGTVIAPTSRRISPWNFYPDPNCGEDIQKGQYVFERDEITARGVKDLIGVPGYIESQIMAVLEEGPGKKFEASSKLSHKSALSDKDLFEIWYFQGIVERDDLEVLGVMVEEGETAHAIVTMINDRPIKAALQPLDNGEFPYDLMPWQRRADMPWGTGVARQVRTPQRMVNAATRAMMDNAGVSAGGQFVINREVIQPADGSWSIVPRKLWFMTGEGKVNDAFASVQLASMQADLMAIIQYAQKMAEDVTGLPMILQGQQGAAPETVGGMQMLQNNASSVLRRLARTFDDAVTEPHIRRYYDWLMEYGEDEKEKGDFQIDARGSTALVERDINNQSVLQMAPMAVPGNPYGIDPKRWFKEVCLAQRMDPSKFQYTDEEEAQLQQNMQPPVIPQIEAAKIRAQVDMKKLEVTQGIAQQDGQLESLKIKSDTDRDTAWVQAETQRTMVEANAKREELMLKRELEMLKYANEQKISLDAIKAQLAAKAADIQLERDLAGASNAVKLETSKKPPLEPAGKAPAGQAWAQ
jgi:hypothetical protein